MLQIDGVSKRFGDRMALGGASFSVGRGRLTGFVGSNGAGKTTAMRIILGVLAPDSGTVSLDGKPLDEEARRSFGYMPEERGLYPKMRISEQLIYLARLHGVPARRAASNTAALLERLGLGERANDAVESLSLGNQQRAQIAAALVHDPSVLVLDEPFSGLDPIAVDTVVAVLQDVAASGVPVLFSSHQLDLVERLCDDLVVIANGQIRASGSREELRTASGGSQYELLVEGDTAWLRNAPGVKVIDFDGGYALFESESVEAAQAVLRRAIELGTVASFTPRLPSLTEIFKEVVK